MKFVAGRHCRAVRLLAGLMYAFAKSAGMANAIYHVDLRRSP